jgi:hypothetical protein
LRFYLDSGDSGPSQDGKDQTVKVYQHLSKIGYKANQTLFYYLDKGGQHSESYWGKRFNIPLQYLYSWFIWYVRTIYKQNSIAVIIIINRCQLITLLAWWTQHTLFPKINYWDGLMKLSIYSLTILKIWAQGLYTVSL